MSGGSDEIQLRMDSWSLTFRWFKSFLYVWRTVDGVYFNISLNVAKVVSMWQSSKRRKSRLMISGLNRVIFTRVVKKETPYGSKKHS